MADVAFAMMQLGKDIRALAEEMMRANDLRERQLQAEEVVSSAGDSAVTSDNSSGLSRCVQ